MSAAPGTTLWFARHEWRLAWRDWLAMMSGGRRKRLRRAVIAIAIFVLFMHFVAYWMVGRYADAAADRATFVTITASILLSWLLMISQAMESTTRAFYARSDLDLILASPAAAEKLFAVRIATVALSMALMALPLAAPFIDILVARGGWRWLGAYGLIVAMGAAATALAVGLSVALFRVIGAKRTRFVAQVVAAVIGAAFVIGLQIAAILSYGTISRVSVLQSQAVLAHMPDSESVIWWPARAVLGDGVALFGVLVVSLAMLAAVIAVVAPRFGAYAISAASVDGSPVVQVRRATAFRATSPQHALRSKEWTLLRRDPWLVSQTLMQMLYLVPPAVLLWRSFDDGNGAYQLLVPVLVMAAGQLAGGLAWLAISGEDCARPGRLRTGTERLYRARQDRSRAWRHRRDFRPAGRGARHCLAVARAGHGGRDCHRGGGCDLDPTLVSQPGQAQPISPPAGFLAFGHFRRGVLLDRLGRHGGSRRRQPHACHRTGVAGALRGGGYVVHEPAPAASLIMLSTRRTLL